MINTLKTSYQKTPYKLGGNGPRNVGVLTEALQNIDDNLESDIYGMAQLLQTLKQKSRKFSGNNLRYFFQVGRWLSKLR